MKDENIKEILDYFKRSNKNKLGFEQDKIITFKEANQLLDYITNLRIIEQQYSAILSENAELENKINNLQEENKEWSMIFDTFSKRPYAHKYLEEKKKELGNKKIIGLDSEMIYKDYYDYKSRCEKAIEITQNLLKTEDKGYYQILFQKQLDILGGDDNE